MKNIYTIVLLLFIYFNSYPQQLELLGHIDVLPGRFITDVWGYVDEENNKEYAIIGSYTGIEIIDVTDPSNLQQVYFSSELPGFDMKVWQNYLYLVTGSGGALLGKILDISDPSNPQLAGSFNSAHNIFISDDGYLYAEFPGLVVYNLNNTPESPELVFNDGTQQGHDAAVIGNILFDFHGNATNIYEISAADNFSLNLLGSINDLLIEYHHSGWITNDGKYLFICDELANHPTADITVWDISNFSEPVKVDEYADPDATVHNLYIIDNYAYVSYYTAGLRIFDVSDPENIEVAAHYDTSPQSGEGFDGAFGVYPFLPSKNILVSDQTGLYVFRFHKPTDVIDVSEQVNSFELYQNYPNPFNPSTKIKYSLNESSNVSIKVYDVLGNELAVLVNDFKPAGAYEVNFNGENLSSGIYYYTITAGNFTSTKKMMLLK